MTPIEQIKETLAALLDAIEVGETAQVKQAQERFVQATQYAWDQYEQGKITVTMRGLPRVMYQWVTRELPEMIQDREQWPMVKRELRRFQRLLDALLDPSPVE